MNIRFISDGPALLVRNRERILVVADLHIGIEADLAAHGWHIASRTRERLERLVSCISATSPDLLLLLGDIKHNLPKTTQQEYHELPEFLETIRKLVPFCVLPGNHDTAIRRFLNEGELLKKNGVILDGTGYLHGHMIPSPLLKGRLIIAGHHHPLVSIHDEVGCALRTPAYLFACLEPSPLFNQEKREKDATYGLPPVAGDTRALFMPAFNEFAGFDIMRIIRHPFSPLSRAIRAESAEVFLTDGTYVGPAGSLEKPFVTA